MSFANKFSFLLLYLVVGAIKTLRIVFDLVSRVVHSSRFIVRFLFRKISALLMCTYIPSSLRIERRIGANLTYQECRRYFFMVLMTYGHLIQKRSPSWTLTSYEQNPETSQSSTMLCFRVCNYAC